MRSNPAFPPRRRATPEQADASQPGSDRVGRDHPDDGSSRAGPLDEQVLDQLRDLQQDGKPDLIEALAKTYLDSSASLMSEIVSVAEHDPRALREAAHRLKSSSANLGAKRLQALCAVLEEQARLGEPYDERAVARVQAEYRAVREALVELSRKKAS